MNIMKMIETKKGINMNSKTLKRHSGIGIFLHWFKRVLLVLPPGYRPWTDK